MFHFPIFPGVPHTGQGTPKKPPICPHWLYRAPSTPYSPSKAAENFTWGQKKAAGGRVFPSGGGLYFQGLGVVGVHDKTPLAHPCYSTFFFRFPAESIGQPWYMFSSYSQAQCQVSCAMYQASEALQCVPWNIASQKKLSLPLCNQEAQVRL